MKIHFGHNVGKYDPLVLNYPVTFVPGSARCSSALCLFFKVCFPVTSINRFSVW